MEEHYYLGEALTGKSNPTGKRKVGITMLEFWQNGKKIEVNAIYGKGKVGQMVIFGQRVDWGVNPDPTESPLSQYPCPSIFTIVEKQEGKDGYYILSDANGNRIKLQDKFYGASESYLYDAQEWLTWNAMHETEKLSRKQRKIEQLEGHVELLKNILIKQGTHIVTEAQAKDLGL